MSQLALSALFEFLCYGSTAIINILTLSVRGPILYVRFCRIKSVLALIELKPDNSNIPLQRHLVRPRMVAPK